MKPSSFKEYISQTIAIGKSLISSNYTDSRFADYLSNIDFIIRCLDSSIIKDQIIQRTFELIKSSSPSYYRLNIFTKVYYALMASKLSNGILLTNNSTAQINKRYVLETNSRLSVIINAKEKENVAISFIS